MLLKDIRIDGGTQSRVKINQAVVDDYAECLQEGAVFPPIEVFYDGINHWLVDGFTRYFAHKKAGLEKIEVKVHNGTQRDAQKYSLGVNDKHGQQRTKEDKVNAVTIAFNDVEWSEYSDREIARLCNVSNGFVGRIRKSLDIHRPTEKTVKRAGKTIKVETKNIGKNQPTKDEEYNPEDDKISELAELNEQLLEENLLYKDKELALTGDQKKIVDEIDELRKYIKQLEAELKVVKLSRDQLQNKCAEQLKQIDYWRKRAEKK